MALPTRRTPHGERSRTRLVVVQVLMISLFVTLFARLWFLQVLTGDSYQAQAAHQSLRDVVVQPARGLIVDDVGRPLVANRSSWVVSVDRTLLAGMDSTERDRVVARVARAVKLKPAVVQAKMLLCSEPGAKSGLCWNGSPFQPVPIASDVSQASAVKILEETEKYPGVLARTESLRAYPSPYGVNAAHVLGYLSAITESEMAEAKKTHDTTVNGASVVGRAGLEKSYDKYLRGVPGHQKVAVDSRGRVLGDSGLVKAVAGDTLVTSIDARVQSVVEKEPARSIKVARGTYDKITHRNYEADSGAAIVMEAKTGRIVAMASQPTYDPSVWVGGISQKQLDRLYSKKADTPLLSRATQAQLAPGSTWKPVMSVAALNNGFKESDTLDCSSGLQVGNRWFKNYESAAYGQITFARAIELSCDTFFYRVGLKYWQKYGSDPANVNAKDPLATGAKNFGFGKITGIDIPGEAAGRVPDRHWRLDYWKAMKSYYCKIDKNSAGKPRDFLRVFAHEFCLEGYKYRAGDAVNFSIGQGDTMVTPLQLARAYAALSNGGTLFEPRVAKAVVDPQGKVVKTIPPKVMRHVKSTKEVLRYVNHAMLGTPKSGTLAWKFGGFPLDKVQVRGKTGTAEVHGKQTTGWVGTYDDNYVVVMMISQAGTGSGSSGDAVRKIWETLYGVKGEQVNPSKAAIAGTTPPKKLPTFASDGSILPPVTAAAATKGSKERKSR